jgi:hypothetical protein
MDGYIRLVYKQAILTQPPAGGYIIFAAPRRKGIAGWFLGRRAPQMTNVIRFWGDCHYRRAWFWRMI